MGIEQGFHKGTKITERPETKTEDRELRGAAKAVWDLFRETTLSPEHRENGKTPWLVFDVDGVLIQPGIQTTVNEYTIREYFDNHMEAVVSVRESILRMKAKGIHVAMNTGRGLSFAQEVARELFGEGVLDACIAEGGAIIAYADDVTAQPHTAEPKSIEAIRNTKEAIEQEFIRFGWTTEPKNAIVTLRPPQDMDAKIAATFVRQWYKKRGLLQDVQIKPSATAVDVVIVGAAKEDALNEVMESSAVIYFGDSPGDHGAMHHSHVVFTPQNADPLTHEFAADATKRKTATTELAFGLKRNEIDGVSDALVAIEQVVEFLQTQKHEQPRIALELAMQLKWEEIERVNPRPDGSVTVVERARTNMHHEGMEFPVTVERHHVESSTGDHAYTGVEVVNVDVAGRDAVLTFKCTFYFGEESSFRPSIQTFVQRVNQGGYSIEQLPLLPSGLAPEVYNTVLDYIQQRVNELGVTATDIAHPHTFGISKEQWRQLFEGVLEKQGYKRTGEVVWQKEYTPKQQGS